ncbi:MAG: hypothetical protein LC792_06530 [Actinobacteria bacterium]|nr:hypothetical protein [Actinomycetota bacterium]
MILALIVDALAHLLATTDAGASEIVTLDLRRGRHGLLVSADICTSVATYWAGPA